MKCNSTVNYDTFDDYYDMFDEYDDYEDFEYKEAIACRDGYIDATTGACTTSCGIGYFGLATYNYRGLLDKSLC